MSVYGTSTMLRPNLFSRSSALRSSLSSVAAQRKTLEIPYDGGLPFFGTGMNMKKAGGAPKFHEYIDARHKEMGPIFREHMGNNFKMVFVSDPNLMRNVFSIEGKFPDHFVPRGWALYNKIHDCKRGLFFMEGEEWYKYRKLLNKSFLAPDVLSSLKNIQNCLTGDLIQRWKNYDGQEVPDIAAEFYRHSISFVLGSMIGDSYLDKRDLFTSHVDKIARESVNIFKTSALLESMMSVRLAQLLKLSLWTNFESAVHASLDASRRVVGEALKDLSPNGLLYKLVRDGVPEDMIYAIVDDLLLGAGDTTSHTSQWICYYLGKHREVQEAARNDPTLVRGVVKETLRLSPPAVFISRIIPEETTLGDYRVNKGELVMVSLYSCGRNDRVYPSANTFRPDRWTKVPDLKGYRGVTETVGYLPFGMGVRSCVGIRLANAQLHLTASEILKNYELTTLEDVDIVLRLVPVPSKPLKIRIRSL